MVPDFDVKCNWCDARWTVLVAPLTSNQGYGGVCRPCLEGAARALLIYEVTDAVTDALEGRLCQPGQ